MAFFNSNNNDDKSAQNPSNEGRPSLSDTSAAVKSSQTAVSALQSTARPVSALSQAKLKSGESYSLGSKPVLSQVNKPLSQTLASGTLQTSRSGATGVAMAKPTLGMSSGLSSLNSSAQTSSLRAASSPASAGAGSTLRAATLSTTSSGFQSKPVSAGVKTLSSGSSFGASSAPKPATSTLSQTASSVSKPSTLLGTATTGSLSAAAQSIIGANQSTAQRTASQSLSAAARNIQAQAPTAKPSTLGTSLPNSNDDFQAKIAQAKAALSTVSKVKPFRVGPDGKTSLVTENQEVTDVQYRRFAAFVEEKSGIVLGEGKQYLVNSRLSSLLVKFHVQTVDELINKAMEDRPNNKVQEEVIDAMTTNETLWFRDTYPYKALEDIIIPELAKKAKYPVRIWSAACSSGQEPYSIAMIIQEQMAKMLHIDPKQTQIIGTDLSPEMLSICRRGQYDVHALSRGLSPERKSKFFKPAHRPNMMVIDSRVKSMVEFRPMNLLGSYALMGRFDVIFCRNVLIYFSNDVKADILRKLTMCLNPGGYLILGSTETLVGVADKYEMLRCNPGIIYRLKPQRYAFGS